MAHNTPCVTLANIVDEWLHENYFGLRVTHPKDKDWYVYPTIFAENTPTLPSGTWSGRLGMVDIDGYTSGFPPRGKPHVLIFASEYTDRNFDVVPLVTIYPTDPDFFKKLYIAIDRRLTRKISALQVF